MSPQIYGASQAGLLCQLSKPYLGEIFVAMAVRFSPIVEGSNRCRTSIAMPHPCHIIVADNPAMIYASRGGTPDKILPVLKPFLTKFWQERDASGEHADTPECLVAQITVRFGFEICEDDFSNLRVGVHYNADAEYLYYITPDREINVWVADPSYRANPELGLRGCRSWISEEKR